MIASSWRWRLVAGLAARWKMVVKRCFYGLCNSDSRYSKKSHMSGVFFVIIPNRKNQTEIRRRWLQACGRSVDGNGEAVDFKPTSRNPAYICSKHFVGGKGPTKDHPDPVQYSSLVQTLHRRRRIIDDSKIVPSQRSLVLLQVQKISKETCNIPQDPYQLNVQKNSKDLCTISPELCPVNEGHFGIMMGTNNIDADVQTSQNNSPKNETVISVEVITNDCDSNEEEEGTEFQLSDIRSSFICHHDWNMIISEHEVTFSKIKNDAFLLKLSVNPCLEISLTVLRRRLLSHQVLDEIPEKLTCMSDVHTSLLFIDQWKVCIGNSDEKMKVAFFSRKKQSGFYCWITNAVHSGQCLLLAKSERCKKCQLYRSFLRTVLLRNRRMEEKFKTKYEVKISSKEDIFERND